MLGYKYTLLTDNRVCATILVRYLDNLSLVLPVWVLSGRNKEVRRLR